MSDDVELANKAKINDVVFYLWYVPVSKSFRYSPTAITKS